MSLYIPPLPKRRRSIWPVIGLGLGLFVLGGAAAFGIAMWMTLEQRTSIAGLTAQMQQAGVSRAADVETIVLPRAQTAAGPVPASASLSTQPMPSVPDEIGQLADAVAGGEHGVAVIRGADGRPVLRLRASGGDAALDRITARLPGTVQDGTLALPPGLVLPDGDLNAHFRIVAANPNTLAGAGRLTAGQRLRIPGA